LELFSTTPRSSGVRGDARRFPQRIRRAVVSKARTLLKKEQSRPSAAPYRYAVAEGVDGMIYLLSARASRTPAALAAADRYGRSADGPEYGQDIQQMRDNGLVRASSSPRRRLALAVIALDSKVWRSEGAKTIIGGIAKQMQDELVPVGSSRLTARRSGKLAIPQRRGARPIVYRARGLLSAPPFSRDFLQARVAFMLLAACDGAGRAVVAGPVGGSGLPPEPSSSTY